MARKLMKFYNTKETRFFTSIKGSNPVFSKKTVSASRTIVVSGYCLVVFLITNKKQQITNAPCPMPHAPCPMPNSQCPMPHAPCPMPHPQCPIPNIIYDVASTRTLRIMFKKDKSALLFPIRSRHTSDRFRLCHLLPRPLPWLRQRFAGGGNRCPARYDDGPIHQHR